MLRFGPWSSQAYKIRGALIPGHKKDVEQRQTVDMVTRHLARGTLFLASDIMFVDTTKIRKCAHYLFSLTKRIDTAWSKVWNLEWEERLYQEYRKGFPHRQKMNEFRLLDYNALHFYMTKRNTTESHCHFIRCAIFGIIKHNHVIIFP